MHSFFSDYKKAYEQEALQFIFLSDERDANILINKYKKDNLGEYVRLACIALVYGYRRIFLKISATVEKDMKEFIDGLDCLNGNFALLEIWINDFISSIKDKDAQNLSREYWEEKKAMLDKDNFTASQLFLF